MSSNNQPTSLDVPDKQPLGQLFDTDIDNYSTAELFSILGFVDDVDPDDIKKVTDDYYNKYISQDRDVANFFMAIQTRLLTYVAELDIASKQYTGDDADRPLPSSSLNEDDMQNSVDQFKTGLMSSMDYADTNQELEDYEDKLRSQNAEGGDTVIQNFVQSTDLNSWLNSQSSIGSEVLPGTANINSAGVTTQNASAKQDTQKIFDADVKQGRLNPDMKNVMQRLVNIDSSYRTPLTQGNIGTDDYTFTLNETLTSVLSLTLYSLEIPHSWYTFTAEKGMTGFAMSTLTNSGDPWPPSGTDAGITILDGNYTGLALLQAVEDAMNQFVVDMIASPDNDETACDITSAPVAPDGCVGAGPTWWTLSQNAITGKTEINAVAQVADGAFYPYVVQLLWFDISFETDSLLNSTISSNLGWAMGYRYPSTTLFKVETGATSTLTAATSPSLLDTSGTKYIIIKLDDYKTNRMNKGLIAIESTNNEKIGLPDYLNADTTRSRFTSNSDIVLATAAAPRLLTAAQLYTINAISKRNAQSAIRLRGNSPDNGDIFAKVPLKKNAAWSSYSSATGISTVIDDGPASPIVDFSGPLQNNIREYFGPVDITTMKVILYDDKGNLLDLNGMDWSFSIIVKCLYQY